MWAVWTALLLKGSSGKILGSHWLASKLVQHVNRQIWTRTPNYKSIFSLFLQSTKYLNLVSLTLLATLKTWRQMLSYGGSTACSRRAARSSTVWNEYWQNLHQHNMKNKEWDTAFLRLPAQLASYATCDVAPLESTRKFEWLFLRNLNFLGLCKYSNFLISYLTLALGSTATFIFCEVLTVERSPRWARCSPSIGALRRSSTREARFRGCCFSAVQGCSARGVLHGAINTSKSTNIAVTCFGKKTHFQSGVVHTCTWYI